MCAVICSGADLPKLFIIKKWTIDNVEFDIISC